MYVPGEVGQGLGCRYNDAVGSEHVAKGIRLATTIGAAHRACCSCLVPGTMHTPRLCGRPFS